MAVVAGVDFGTLYVRVLAEATRAVLKKAGIPSERLEGGCPRVSHADPKRRL